MGSGCDYEAVSPQNVGVGNKVLKNFFSAVRRLILKV